MRSILRILVFSVLLILVLGLPAVSLAQSSTPRPVTDDEVNAVAKQLYCPVCENTPLDVCPTQACSDWRDEIRQMLSQGQTEAQIKQYFVDRFGDRVLGAPPARGLNWLVYIVPPLAIVIGAFILYRAFKTWRQPVTPMAPPLKSSNEASPDTSIQDEYIARLEEQLKKSDR